MIEQARRVIPWAASAAAIAAIAAGVSVTAQSAPTRHQHTAGHAGSHQHGQAHHRPDASRLEHGPDHPRGCDPEQMAAHLHPEHLADLHEALRGRHAADGTQAAQPEALHEAIRTHHATAHAARHDADPEHTARAGDHTRAGHEPRRHHLPCHDPNDRTGGRTGPGGAAKPAGNPASAGGK